jgi:hypothetical protein
MSEPYIVVIPDDATASERKYMDALARIVAREPITPRLAKAAKNGALRPSQPNVAEEAGMSRGPISGSRCALPRVKSAILKAQAAHRRSKRGDEVLAELSQADENKAERRRAAKLQDERDEYRAWLNASYTSSAASVMLARAIEQNSHVKDVDVTKLRRDAEQLALSNDPPSAL